MCTVRKFFSRISENRTADHAVRRSRERGEHTIQELRRRGVIFSVNILPDEKFDRVKQNGEHLFDFERTNGVKYEYTSTEPNMTAHSAKEDENKCKQT